jgi:hypothetical protein
MARMGKSTLLLVVTMWMAAFDINLNVDAFTFALTAVSSRCRCTTLQERLFTTEHTAPALLPIDKSTGSGAPPLSVLCTNDPRTVEKWLTDCARASSGGSPLLLGFDTESVAKAGWFPERRNLPDGPACLQLSTLESCLVVQLAQCGDGKARCAPEVLRVAMEDESIVKVGVGIDLDALEMYRWGQDSLGLSSSGKNWKMRSRFDLGGVAGGTANQRSGLRQIVATIANVDLPKSKKIAMSDWGVEELSKRNVAYAARDAWASAIVMHELQKAREDVFGVESILQNFIAGERELEDMDQRAVRRKEAKLQLKELQEEDETSSATLNNNGKKNELWSIMKEMKPDPGHVFNGEDFPW